VRFATLPPEEAQARLEESISGLQRTDPTLSASTLLSKPQRNALIVAGVVLVAAGAYDLRNTAIGLLTLAIVLYIAMTLNRIVLFVRARRPGNEEIVTDEEARAVPDHLLPVYTILVPAYREPEVIQHLVHNLGRLEYPTDRLDIKLLLEEDDLETIDVVRHMDVGDHMEVIVVPPAEPRTKPKALNYALPASRGDIVTIYDAEDEPDPLQLRRAAVALARLGPEVACLQAKLSFANVGQNIITKWFTIEYAMWFSLFLPGLVDLGAPLPLGGTSNHFRRHVLLELHGWDPFNVTEDADLGVRLGRLGYRCGVLDSTTLEEANSDFINWVKQRSRWYKGYLQTLIVHLRQPRLLIKQAGLGGALEFALFVGGTPLLAVLNPIFWLMTIVWFVATPHVIKQLFPAPLFYAGTACWIIGNFLVCYLTILTCRLTKRQDLLIAAILVPAYWVMMSLAAVKAFWQLVATPTFWEKTTHGLAKGPVPEQHKEPSPA